MKILLFGANGYGKEYQRLINEYTNAEICAIIDPTADAFRSFDEFLKSSIKADLAIISSPVKFHAPQAKECIDAGIPVLCEKPVCTEYGDALDLMKYSGDKIGVGFQWSWSDGIQNLKRDIKSGLFGEPVSFKCYLSWQRNTDYYKSSSWKGKGYDSIISNATAHYLHNIFFINDCGAAEYDFFTARANDIETFDTCVIKGELENGARFWYGATHCGERYTEPIFEYKYKDATVYYNQNKEDMLYAVLSDGRVIKYGALQSDGVTSQKITKMLDTVSGRGEVLCKISDALFHLKICTDITNAGKVHILKDTVIKNNTVICDGICDILEECYKKEALPNMYKTE